MQVRNIEIRRFIIHNRIKGIIKQSQSLFEEIRVIAMVTFHTHAKVVGIMRQNAKSFRFFTLAFCVHQL